MSTSRKCPNCSSGLPETAPQGLCPKCLYAAALDADKSDTRKNLAEDLTVAAVETCGADESGEAFVGQSVSYFGDYELIEEIARGGMGVVFKARQTSLNRTVAVKMILAGQFAGSADVQRFQVEAQAAAHLQHPNIVAIHEVGEYQDQHYYSMDYIEGHSLSDLARQNPLPARDAARYVATICQAIGYAHDKGILHRDLKPSNVLIDADDQPQITDFGLAKRLHDDSEMTATGQALGTPSYMPPEQASGNRETIGPTADVYSIGAILYELLTGRPPFRAETPLDTLMQVIENEAAPPRLLNSSISRDLETICLKCLEKDPQRRYATAHQLAEDLERYLADEPIVARPVGLAERSRRWARKQRRSVGLSIAAALTALVLGSAALVGWYSYERWRLGHVGLLTDRAPISAEFLVQRDELVIPALTVPTNEPAALPAGDYQLRLSSDGRLSQNFQVNVTRGSEPETYRLNLEDQIVWPSLEIERSYELINVDGSTDVLLLNNDGIVRLDGAEVGNQIWKLKLGGDEPALADFAGLLWPWDDEDRRHLLPDRRPRLTTAASDLDDDGVDDLVLAAQHQAWVLAVSGGTGQILWFAGRGADLKSGAAAQAGGNLQSTSLGTPIVTGDVDGDGVRELVATFADFGGQDQSGGQVHRWVEVLSGASGQSVSKYDFNDAWFDLPGGQEVPPRNRWFSRVTGVNSGGGGASWYGGDVARLMRDEQANGTWHFVPGNAQQASIDGRTLCAVIAGTRLIILDPETGRLKQPPHDLGFPPLRSPIVEDIDGDGSDEVLLVQQTQQVSWTRTPAKFELLAWSLKRQQPLWKRSITAVRYGQSSDWPLVVDLDSDGRKELVLPNGTSMSTTGTGRAYASGTIELIDGGAGEMLWKRSLRCMDQQLDHVIAGEDIDGDGHRELFVATLVGDENDLYVDAISGADGSGLWWSNRRMTAADVRLGRLQWWDAGADGWPQLLVHASNLDRDWTSDSVFLFSAGTGACTREGAGMDNVSLADVDGDGLSDLIAFQSLLRGTLDRGGKLHCLAAEPADSWRRLGVGWVAGQDYDLDSVGDVVQCVDRSVIAVSGRTGRKLWQADLSGETKNRTAIPLTEDLNGDGVPDVLAVKLAEEGNFTGPCNFPLEAISGSSGRILWSADFQVRVLEGALLIDCRQLDGKGSPEIIVALSCDWDYPPRRSIGSPELQHTLAVLAGSNGSVKWKHHISQAYSGQRNRRYSVKRDALRAAYADLNEDGVIDIVVPTEHHQGADSLELRAVSGADGESMWHHKLAPPPRYARWQMFEQSPVPEIGDLDGDGKPEVLVLDYREQQHAGGRKRTAVLAALDGQSGTERWTWQSAVNQDCGRISAHTDSLDERPSPRLIRSGDKGRPLVCLNLWGEPGELVTLDQNGKLIRRLVVSALEPTFQCHFDDLDDDGKDELVFIEGVDLKSISPTTGRTNWTWTIPSASNSRIVDVLWCGPRAETPVVVVQTDFTMHGVCGADGKSLWSATSPRPRSGRGAVRVPSDLVLINGDGNLGDQRVVFQIPRDVAVCSRVLPLDSQRSRKDLALHRVPAVVAPNADDPRMLVQSPFARSSRNFLSNTLWGLCMTIVLIALPLGYLRHLVRMKTWSLRTLLLSPLVVVVILLCLQIPTPESVDQSFTMSPQVAKLNFALMHLPLLTLTALLVALARRRRWKSLAALLLSTIVLAIVVATLTISFYPRQLLPGERYTWDGWAYPWFIGIIMVGWLALAVQVVLLLIRSAKRWLWSPSSAEA